MSIVYSTIPLMYRAVLPEGGSELSDITYEIVQLQHTLLEQSVGLDTVLEANDRFDLLTRVACAEMITPDPDRNLIGTLLDASRRELSSEVYRRKAEILDPVRSIIIDGFRVVEVRPNVLKLCHFREKSEDGLSMVWLGAQALDRTIELTKTEKWLSRSSATPLKVSKEDHDIVRGAMEQLQGARDILKDQTLY